VRIPADVAEAGAGLGLDGVPTDAARVGTGHIHDSWVVTCEIGAPTATPVAPTAPAGTRYLVQRINTVIFEDPRALAANLGVVARYLRAPPVMIPTANGSFLWHSPSGQWWRAFEFVEGTITTPNVASAAVAEELGKAFGGFHRDTAGLPPTLLRTILPGFHDPARRRRQLDDVVEADPCGRVGTSRRELGLLASVDHLAGLAGVLSSTALPARVAHFDAKPANVLFDARSGRARGVIDLDTVMPGSWLWDIGDLIRSGTCPAAEDSVELDEVSLDLGLYRALLGGYLDEAGPLLSAEERAAMASAGLVVTYEQAVRFLTDYLAGDVYYRVDRPAHNRDRFWVQLTLLQSMLADRSAMIAG
jgi:Ser/Thr protein kinase RdoA (MazF antagonist)